jgi:DNA-binding NarL/FixJ family response regulator
VYSLEGVRKMGGTDVRTGTGNTLRVNADSVRRIRESRRPAQAPPGGVRTDRPAIGGGARPDGLRPEAGGTFTPRERDIMDLLVRGHTVSGIASQLGVATKTVRNNLCRIFAKLGVCRQPEAILVWLGYDFRR